jgi:hypothetical protein
MSHLRENYLSFDCRYFFFHFMHKDRAFEYVDVSHHTLGAHPSACTSMLLDSETTARQKLVPCIKYIRQNS